MPISTLHFYERKADRIRKRLRPIIGSIGEILRRVTVIKVAQSAGIPLAEISEALQLPRDAPPYTRDWERIADNWHDGLTRRIELLTALRDKMAMCIGCGCLSVKRCPLVNADDHLAENGPGARLL